ncbi:MAG: tRNA guanosine(34) transglycosylase Tgt [bacterium]|nr:tRNA guanosine(34) transglycosylase Tgt [bacterium]
MPAFDFKILKKSKKSAARLGALKTPHGVIQTPAFVPVATKGALRGADFPTAKKYGADIFMMNTFHLFHNGRYQTIYKAGGLHKFTNCQAPIMTDSGGFQVFSLGFGNEHNVGKVAPDEELKSKNGWQPKKNYVKISEEGVKFVSPFDGHKLEMTPESSIKIQQQLGADLIFAFDECTSPKSDYEYTKKSMEMTHRWADRCLKAFKPGKQALFGIVQGGEFKDLRRQSAEFMGQRPFFGIGIGGAFGKNTMYKILEEIQPFLPEEKPRHLLGIGEPENIIESVKRGIDMFDCVTPTRLARHNTAMTSKGKINLKAAKFLKDKKPIDPQCACRVCQNHSRSYICHLLKEKEIAAIILLTEHNLAWILNFIAEIRNKIAQGKI